MLDWVADIMDALGYVGVGFLMFLENVFPPIPSEVIMPLAGFAAGRGEMSLWGVIVAGSLGSVLGQYPLYYLGRKLGRTRLTRLADRHGRWLMVSGRDVERASDWFDRRGAWTVALCRLLPGLRSFISIPAGVARMNLALFTLYSVGGIALWSAALALAGWFLGDNYDRVESWLGPATYVIVGALAAGALFFVGRRWWRCKNDRAACAQTPPSEDATEPNAAGDGVRRPETAG